MQFLREKPPRTIYALSTPPGRGAIAIVRISGTESLKVWTFLTHRHEIPTPRKMVLVPLYARSGGQIDEAMGVWYKKPKSYTGEDMVEWYVHGSVAVIQALFRELGNSDFLRMAEPGEFTARAVVHGKMSLAKAEGVRDLVDSRTEWQRKAALGQVCGSVDEHIRSLQQRLREFLVQSTASIDFAEEDTGDADQKILLGCVEDIKRWTQNVEMVRDGVTLVLTGPPNSGKSTLLNFMAGRKIAITHPIPGTTRDTLEVALELAGLPVTCVDTAGIRDVKHPVEREGIRRAKQAIERAHLVLRLWDVVADRCISDGGGKFIDVCNKIDLLASEERKALPRSCVCISARTGEGIPELLKCLEEKIRNLVNVGDDSFLMAGERQRVILMEAKDLLLRALDATTLDLAASWVEKTLATLGRVVGEVTTEDVLDGVFSSFCIGK